MAGPVLTPDEIAQMQKEQTKATAAAATFTAQIAAQQARAAELAKVDSAFKKFFDYYNDDIIGKYEAERKIIDGKYMDTPVVEADIVAVASLAGGRCQPSLPATDLIRIPQFDGTPLLQEPTDYEFPKLADQAEAEGRLVTGWPATAPAATVLTSTALTPTSTTLELKDLLLTFSITPGDVLVIKTLTQVAVIKFLSFTMGVTPTPPPYIATCNIQLIVPPTGTIPIGEKLIPFLGFTNAERTTKTPADPLYQPLMDYLVLQLQTKINIRKANLTLQLTPIAANQDPDGTAELTQATTDVNSSITFLTNYLITTNVSNTGISSLSGERVARSAQATARVAQIVAAYTGRSKNYFNERYNNANNRANTARGSLRLQKNSEQGAATSQSFASSLGDQASAIGGLLP